MTRPTILVCAGHDPSGGAGIQADIEAIGANGAHAATAVTALTVQDTRDVTEAIPVDPGVFQRAVDTVCADLAIAAIKTGVLANAAQVDHVAALKRRHPRVPLVVDPVLAAAGGGRLTDDSVGQALVEHLIPLADLITPNLGEARRLTGTDHDAENCARALARLGPDALVTGGDGEGPDAISTLATRDSEIARYVTHRLADGPFHGSGCTLASAIAARLAHGDTVTTAIDRASAYVHACLKSAYTPGHGQMIPDRVNNR